MYEYDAMDRVGAVGISSSHQFSGDPPLRRTVFSKLSSSDKEDDDDEEEEVSR